MNETNPTRTQGGTTASDGGRRNSPRVEHQEGLKDTIESIIVALILAFVFRAFVVEAFVIPTGSMAPTLYGAHGTILCEDCGTEFAYGLRDLDDKRRGIRVPGSSKAICPNCRHANTNLDVNDERKNPEKGDRILVLKWPLDIGIPSLGPARWDVTVFKDPADGTTNFIKRMAGLPNEVLMILDGDVYAIPTSELSQRALNELEKLRHEKYELRTGVRDGRLRPVPPVVMAELEQKMRVAAKTPEAQEALWFTVHDHDYPPRTLDAHQPRWQPVLGDESGWDATGRRIRFRDRGRKDDQLPLTDADFSATAAYNINSISGPPVADNRVSFVLTPYDSIGSVQVRLGKRGRGFWAKIHMDGRIVLEEWPAVKKSTNTVSASTRLPPFVPGEPVEISFENVDYRLAVSVRGEEVLSSSSDRRSPAYFGPNVKQLRRQERPWPTSPPRIYAEGGNFDLTHLVVQRDVYYFSDQRRHSLPADATVDWAPRGGWASPKSPILLRGHEYFMLGDNTSASKDSRLWDAVGEHLKARGEDFQLGTVPRDQLIGKAFFVYWPAGHRLDWLPFFNRFGIIPDVGRMRWIR